MAGRDMPVAPGTMLESWTATWALLYRSTIGPWATKVRAPWPIPCRIVQTQIVASAKRHPMRPATAIAMTIALISRGSRLRAAMPGR